MNKDNALKRAYPLVYGRQEVEESIKEPVKKKRKEKKK